MRIRSIKPEFWRSDDIDALSIPDRLLFIGLWSYVDDSGVGVDRESSIAADLFAGDLAREPHETSVRVHGGLKRLSEAGLITRYTAQSKRWLHISNWSKHQKINRPTESRRPGPTSDDAEPQQERTEDSVSPHAESPFGTGEQGNRGTGSSRTAAAARRHLESVFHDEFWPAYPLKKDKQDALKAWLKVIRERNLDPARLVQAARSHANDPNRKPGFTKHAATWLNKGAYDNEPEVPEQPQLSAVPDLPMSIESFRERTNGPGARKAAEEAARLIHDAFIPDRPRPRDSQLSELEWIQHLAAQYIDDHADEIRDALERRRAG